VKTQQILDVLDGIPSVSDVSGISDDSGADETWLPRGQRKELSSDTDEVQDFDGRPEEGGAGDSQDLGLPNLYESEVFWTSPSSSDESEVPVAGPSSAAPASKRRRVIGKQRKVWEWSKGDLDPKELHPSKVKPNNVQNCRHDVQFFMNLMGEENMKNLVSVTVLYMKLLFI